MLRSIIQDFAIYVLPMSMVWTLQMPRRQKIAFIFLFGIGLVAVAGKTTRVLCLAKMAMLTYNSRLRTLLLRALSCERNGYLVLHGRLAELVQHRDLRRQAIFNPRLRAWIITDVAYP
jgi:hypothetical protein